MPSSETAKHLAEIFLASTLSPKKKPCRYVNDSRACLLYMHMGKGADPMTHQIHVSVTIANYYASSISYLMVWCNK